MPDRSPKVETVGLVLASFYRLDSLPVAQLTALKVFSNEHLSVEHVSK